jgi:hypothetical protein
MGSALVCVVLGVGPKFEPNKFGGVPPTRFIIPASSACQLVAHNGQRWEQACPPCSERASSPYAALARSAMHTQRAASRCRRYEGATLGERLLGGRLQDSEMLENGYTSASSLESEAVSPSPKDVSPGYFVSRICCKFGKPLCALMSFSCLPSSFCHSPHFSSLGGQYPLIL